MLVCLEHWRSLLYIDYPQIGSHRALFALPYLMTGAGHQSVVIFFVLSGYLISGSNFSADGTWPVGLAFIPDTPPSAALDCAHPSIDIGWCP
jgi:hypothetical protein